MSKVIAGTQASKKIRVLKGQQDVRQVRCTNKQCSALVSATPDGKGGNRHKCHQCGMIITSTRI